MAKQLTLVTQRKLKDIVRQQSKIEELERDLEEMKRNLLVAREEVFRLLKAGVDVESGPCSAVIDVRAGACRPPWKEVYLSHMEREHEAAPDAQEQCVRALYPAKSQEVLVVTLRK